MAKLRQFLLTSLFLFPFLVYPQSLSYQYLLELGKDALGDGDYEQARHYFNLAKQFFSPEGEPADFPIGGSGFKEDRGQKRTVPIGGEPQERGLEREQRIVTPHSVNFETEKVVSIQELKRGELISRSLDFWERKEKVKKKVKEKVNKRLDLAKVSPPKTVGREVLKGKTQVIYLTDELWSTQPKTSVDIEINKSLIVEGRTLSRYLVERPDMIDIKRVDSDRIMITAKKVGFTFLHLWEQRGRWTFTVKVIPPVRIASREREKVLVYGLEPFAFTYQSDWHSYYKNPKSRNLKNLERETLSFNQWLGFSGPTPYGEFDGSLRVAKLDKITKLTNYTVGITDGKLSNFRDFNLRGFDFYTTFSDFSFPGTFLKGAMLESYAFKKNLRYTVIWGREKEGSFGFIAPGVIGGRSSYIEGVRLSLFPNKDNTYSFNFLKGYGAGRQDYLRDEVYSFDGNGRWGGKNFDWEFAFNEDSFAGIINTNFTLNNVDLRLNLRNVESNFTTIVGRPGNRGEKGLRVGATWDVNEKVTLSSDVDVYRTSYLRNEAKPRALNINWDTDLSLKLNSDSNLETTLFYVNEEGLSFPRRYLSLRSTYSTKLGLFKRNFYPYFGAGFDRSRNPLSPSSDYNSYRVFTGVRFPLLKNFFLFANYNYRWLRERLTKLRAHPSVLELGIDYRKEVVPNLDLDVGVVYRDENDAELPHSFLAGEDRIDGTLKLEFAPPKDTRFFIEGRIRNVWAQLAQQNDYAEVDLRLGLKTSWNTFFRWNPRGRICGTVFKDSNGNGKRDNGEPPLEGVKVKVGKKEIVTNSQGYFSTVIRGKRAVVRIVEKTLPEGYILTTPALLEVDIVPGKVTVDFGASAFSSVEGIVFHDLNGNNKFDPEDVPLPYVRLYLGKRTSFTNLEGIYHFKNLGKGKYILKLDIGSLPLEYIPLVPIHKEIALFEGARYIYSIPVRKK